MSNSNQFPAGWNEERVQEVIRYYENQTEDEAVEEDERVNCHQTLMQVPSNLVPEILELIAKKQLYTSVIKSDTDEIDQ